MASLRYPNLLQSQRACLKAGDCPAPSPASSTASTRAPDTPVIKVVPPDNSEECSLELRRMTSPTSSCQSSPSTARAPASSGFASKRKGFGRLPEIDADLTLDEAFFDPVGKDRDRAMESMREDELHAVLKEQLDSLAGTCSRLRGDEVVSVVEDGRVEVLGFGPRSARSPSEGLRSPSRSSCQRWQDRQQSHFEERSCREPSSALCVEVLRRAAGHCPSKVELPALQLELRRARERQEECDEALLALRAELQEARAEQAAQVSELSTLRLQLKEARLRDEELLAAVHEARRRQGCLSPAAM
eukprot:TRINITY_DN100588_c0_g1_i1.p1 TRINITY_DN100588_c0_g1~~TRINITY_DN100588_c0_g1_i1.p1  ORF type:complete len:302 (+),score=78.69 TRINITY_DN100588_c0_g1_i1:60-965(+)